MTAAEWDACSSQPVQMLRQIRDRLTPRKRQLLACAVCRLIPLDDYEPWMLAAIRAAEEFAEERIDAREFHDRRHAFLSKARRFKLQAPGDFRLAMILGMYNSSNLYKTLPDLMKMAASQGVMTARRPVIRAECGVIRDLVDIHAPSYRQLKRGEQLTIWFPKEKLVVPETAKQIAAAIEGEQAFENLPILADAMEDSGCTDERFLKHLRARAPHYRGCWALDLILGNGS